MDLFAPFEPGGHGFRPLLSVFLLWKALIIVIACASPGVGYDTSTRILFDQYRSRPPTWIEGLVEHAVLRLTRWDGIYFAVLSERGHANEQDWAFSWLLTRSVDRLASTFWGSLTASQIVDQALLCILISHISHFLAVIVIYRIALELVPRSNQSRQRIAYTAALLHIVSPAGIFLSVPSGESAFAWFNFVGTLSYIYAAKVRSSALQSLPKVATFTVVAGLSFGIAAMMRGNGLLSGILFALDALQDIMNPRMLFSSFTRLGRLAATGVGGLLVGIGYAIPQIVAYLEYCTGGQTRPWCQRVPPSIFSWVQSHYWNVGFLRYWTLSNIPLFVLAIPMISVLLATAIAAIQDPGHLWKAGRAVDAKTDERIGNEARLMTHIFQVLAVPQLVLALLTATTFHVQIINRISSGYPLWYIVLAIWLHDSSSIYQTSKDVKAQNVLSKREGTKSSKRDPPTSKRSQARHMQWVVRSMAMYAVVQGGLYACFLPPA